LTDVLWTELAAVRAMKLPWLRDKLEINNERMYCTEGAKDWFAVVRTSRKDNPDALQGFHRCMFLIDEASGVPDEVMEVMRGAMGDEGTYAVMTGNPTKLDGYFWDAFHKGNTWHKLHFASTDTLTDAEYRYEYLDPHGDVREMVVRGRQRREWVESMKAEFGESSETYKIRVLGEFGSGSVEKLLTYPVVVEAFDRPGRDTKGRMRVLGVDVAWTGSDDTAVVGRCGETVEVAESWNGSDTVETAAKVRAINSEFKADKIIVDTIGVGAGVYDQLRRSGLPVYALATNIPAPDDNEAACKTMRDWLWWRCRKFFKQKHPTFKGAKDAKAWKTLAGELCDPSYSFKTGALRVESKDEKKKRGEKSPNIADALNNTLLFDFETAKPRGSGDTGSVAKKKKGFVNRRSWAYV
jgi:hypothetical protein